MESKYFSPSSDLLKIRPFTLRLNIRSIAISFLKDHSRVFSSKNTNSASLYLAVASAVSEKGLVELVRTVPPARRCLGGQLSPSTVVLLVYDR